MCWYQIMWANLKLKRSASLRKISMVYSLSHQFSMTNQFEYCFFAFVAKNGAGMIRHFRWEERSNGTNGGNWSGNIVSAPQPINPSTPQTLKPSKFQPLNPPTLQPYHHTPNKVTESDDWFRNEGRKRSKALVTEERKSVVAHVQRMQR